MVSRTTTFLSESNAVTFALGTVAPAQFQHVAKPERGHQRAAGALALDDGVGGDGRAVNDELEGGAVNFGGA